ncbi:DMT family transporter [Levilactobacillus tangyuanensis]|uniref:DMT family transporter n=1 Tax=Levilactobacillus tangyuanensis TaxID=2486021 RepID=A0ABW1TJQ7_9LACO|nr:multidrug efflux SMR transporter [Levilactobacillus tangyuanensis]
MFKHWLNVLLGAIFEVTWVVGFKHADSLLAWMVTAIAVYLSFYFLIRAGRVIPTGTAYAVFVGLGTLGTTTVGILVFNEPVNLIKIGLICLLVVGIVGLQLTTKGAD